MELKKLWKCVRGESRPRSKEHVLLTVDRICNRWSINCRPSLVVPETPAVCRIDREEVAVHIAAENHAGRRRQGTSHGRPLGSEFPLTLAGLWIDRTHGTVSGI